jgi:biopolymer transport protein ExbD
MVDMFAILVIFLLTNSSTVTQWLEVSQSIKLPSAKHASAPQKASSLQITQDAVWDKDTKIVSLSEVDSKEGKLKFKSWLTDQPHTNDFHIAADETIPYGNIKKVISVLQSEKIARVNLAVQPIAGKN